MVVDDEVPLAEDHQTLDRHQVVVDNDFQNEVAVVAVVVQIEDNEDHHPKKLEEEVDVDEKVVVAAFAEDNLEKNPYYQT